MFKKIFKAAKDLVKSPIGQIGIGLLAPQLAGASGLLGGIGSFAARNPALFQGGISLLAGDKPTNVLKNLALGALVSGGANVARGGDFSGGVGDFLGMGDTKFFAKPEQGTFKDFMKDKYQLDLDDPIQFAKFEQLSPEFQMGIQREFSDLANQSSPFMNLLTNPYTIQAGASLGLAKLAADQMKDQQEQAQYFFNPDESQFALAADGGGIQRFAMGTPQFPRMTGDISGPGTGTSDSIPAMLSDGEHVLTKQEVSQIGGGDNDLGHQRLYAARENIRKQANANGIGRI